MLYFDNAGGTAHVTGVQDSAANAWTNITATNQSRAALEWVSIWYRYYASGATVTVTTSFASSNETFGWIGYTSGSDTAPLDASGGSNTRATGLTISTSAAMAVDNELVGVNFGASDPPASWPPTNYTTLLNVNDAVRVHSNSSAYRIYSGSGSGVTESVAISYGALTEDIAGGIATFKPAAAAAAVIPNLVMPPYRGAY